MSGHSKWSQIKRQKGVADAKRGTLFTKLGNAILIAAREGGSDPEMNFRLRLTIEKAKQANMPKENIDRAIKRGTGELAGNQLEEITYEAFGPEGTAILIESITDNKNRTSSVIKNILNKYGGNLGGANSVGWMFGRKGVLYLRVPVSPEKKESLELALIEQGAEDIKEEEEAMIVYTVPDKLEQLKKFLETKNMPLEHAGVELVPQNPVHASDLKNPSKIEKLLAELEGCEEVSNYYSNYEG